MPLHPPKLLPEPDFFNVFGHSYFQYTFGTRNQAGRADAIFRSISNIEHNNWSNYAVNGARLSIEGRQTGGIARILQTITGSSLTGPYVSSGGGAFLLGYGINDLGFHTNTTQYRTAFMHALRAAISRCRISTLREDNYAGGAGTGTIAYGAGFAAGSGGEDFGSGSTYRFASSTTNATVTITLPTDYQGETVAIGFISNAGAVGGTYTFSGTAGVTGTHSTSNIMPSASFNRSYTVKRITGLTSANAGQTIVLTVTSLDAGGNAFFDCFWLEAKNPPPVLVCNIAKLTATGYAIYASWTGTESSRDADVDAWNADIAAVVAEFDGMVQIADIDAVMGKSTSLFSSDGLHPNELGAARIADALLDAVKRLRPSGLYGVAAQTNPPSRRTASLIQPHVSGQWYTSPAFGGTAGTAYTAVSGDVWSIPFFVSSGVERWVQWSVELVTSTVATTVHMAVYEDRGYLGYPQTRMLFPTSAGALSLTTGAGVKTSVTSVGNGYIYEPIDPGLYWLTLKIITAGTTTFRSLKGPNLWMPNLTATGAGGTQPVGFKLTGQGTTDLPAVFPTGGVLFDNAPFVGLKML